jgi:two-component system sensor histidine kinase YesM
MIKKLVKLNFRNKLFLIYAFFVVVILTVIATIYFTQSNRSLISSERQTLRYNAEQIGSRFDDTIARMDHAIEFLLSDINALDGIITLGQDSEGSKIPPAYLNEASSKVRKTLHSYFMEKHFYRVVYFNQNGYVIANNNRDEAQLNSAVTMEDLEWVELASNRRGQSKLIGLHTDDWGLQTQPTVFSLVKEVQGASLGYIEVQYLESELAETIVKPEDQSNIMLFTNDGQLLFAAENFDNLEHYRDIALNSQDVVADYVNPATGTREMVALYHSDKAETVMIAIEDYRDIRSRQMLEMSFLVITWIIIAVLSIVFVWIFAVRLTRPIKQIETLIEQTEISNIDQKLKLDKSVASDEIISLYRSYRGLMKRLADSIEKEKQSAALQMQAQFDTLQAQINPHFIYNILNVISQRSLMAEDELTCEICGSLADILRYSTSTKHKVSTIEEEMTYLEKYCFLLKTRYQHRFEYTSDIDDSIKDTLLPKLTLQQLIENSVSHGFSNTPEVMKVKICGWIENDMVYVCMHDNGQGFSEGKIQELEARFCEFCETYQSGGKIPDLEIGGMGLFNTYARLYLLYKGDLIFELSNDDGAKILIGVKSDSSRMISQGD